MSKLNEVTSTTNNQSNQAPSSRAPFLLAHDNSKVKEKVIFIKLYGDNLQESTCGKWLKFSITKMMDFRHRLYPIDNTLFANLSKVKRTT
jgi:hypothetical protein